MIVQSGGPTAVINNSLIGIIDGISRTPFDGEIYGLLVGFMVYCMKNLLV